MINILRYFHYFNLIKSMRPKRYANLLRLIAKYRCRRILEIGVYDGVHAVQMIETASIFYPINQIEYVGFDLFEQLSKQKHEEEFAKRPPLMNEVRKKLEATGAKIALYQGDTRITLPRLKKQLGLFDFIFIDGGHSIETISSDWNAAKELMHDKTIVIFDDYFSNPHSKVKDLGSRHIINNIDKSLYTVEIMKPKDEFKHAWGRLEVNFVKVMKKCI